MIQAGQNKINTIYISTIKPYDLEIYIKRREINLTMLTLVRYLMIIYINCYI